MSAQSNVGQSLYRHFDLDPTDFQTNIFLEDGFPWFKSDAVIRMMQTLGLPWSLAVAFYPIPKFLRDPLYSFVARHRLKLAGRRETCYVPDSVDRERFIL